MNSNVFAPPKLIRQNAFYKTMEKFHRRSLSLNELNKINFIKYVNKDNTDNLNVKIKRIKTY